MITLLTSRATRAIPSRTRAAGVQDFGPGERSTVWRPRRQSVDSSREARRVREVWQARVELLMCLVARDFKVRYRRSLLGALWIVLRPLLLLAAACVTGATSMAPVDGAAASPWILVGLLHWHLFALSLARGVQSLEPWSNVLMRSTVSANVIVVSSVAVPLVEYAIGMGMLWGLSTVCGVHLASTYPLLFGLAVVQTLATLVIALPLAVGNLAFRDVSLALPLVSSLALVMSWRAPQDVEGAAGFVRWNPLLAAIECGQNLAFTGGSEQLIPLALWGLAAVLALLAAARLLRNLIPEIQARL